MYSSTSSSERGCNERWQYDNGYDMYYRNAYETNPYYATMEHPLVYYAQVPQPFDRSRERVRGSPNCFVKAFRWYTEDRVSNKNASPSKPNNLSGFAVWLDTKYDQFMRESHMDWELYHMKHHTSVIEAERVVNAPNRDTCGHPCTTKRFRVKSPWRKKRRAKSAETKDGQKKSDQSFKYIMKPKDMSRPVSECYHQQSNVTVTSSKKPLTKSQSCTNTKCKEPLDVPQVQEGIQPNRSSQHNTQSPEKQKSNELVKVAVEIKTNSEDFCCQYCETKSTSNVETQYDDSDSTSTTQSENADLCGCKALRITRTPPVAYGINRKSYINCACEAFEIKDVISPPPPPYQVSGQRSGSRIPQKNASSKFNNNNDCQCSKEKVVQVDVQTQCEVSKQATRSIQTTRISSECVFKESTQNVPPPVQCSSKNIAPCNCGQTVKEVIQVRSKCCITQSTAQTSNHSIRLDNKYVQEYPLFMKIVCADKLTDENLK